MTYVIDKDKIHHFMRLRNIATQKDLADNVGITKNQLSIMLSNKNTPLKSTFTRLCSVLEISPLDVLMEKRDTDLDVKEDSDDILEFVDVSNIVPSREYNSIELFAGAGGLALGLEESGFHERGLIEIDKFASETLRINRPNWNVIEEDIVNVAKNGIRNYLPTEYEIDFVSGGYPCQAFSYAGNKLGLADVRGTMFFYFSQIIDDLKPTVFLAENVRGLLTHDKGKTLKTMVDIYESLGYVLSVHLLNANNYGVAQKRERLIIVGVKKDKNIKYRLPKPYRHKPVLRDVLNNVPESIGEKYTEKKKRVLELVPPGGCWRNLPVDLAKEYMGKSYYSGGGRTGMARRISWDEPCLTLTCSPAQKQTERCHPDEVRPFTVREYARIQSFPDKWEFYGSMGQQYKQIGNAVPVKLAKAVGLSIVDVLNQLVE